MLMRSAASTSASSNDKNKTLHNAGYQVIRNAVEVTERVLLSVQKSCEVKTNCIFNHNEIKARNDHKRRQRNLPLKTKYMLRFDESVREIIHKNVNTLLVPTDPVILHSRPGCQPQAAHCDYIPDEALKAVSDEQMPLAVLIALMPNTRLQIWPNSSRLVFLSPSELKQIKSIQCEEVHLNPGDMLVFRGDFVHAGSGYEVDNFRIHYYLDSPLVPRTANRTWLISGSDSELKRIIQPHLSLQTREKNLVGTPSLQGVSSAMGMFNRSKRKTLATVENVETQNKTTEENDSKRSRFR